MSDTTLDPETRAENDPSVDVDAGFLDDDSDFVYIPRENGALRKTLSVLVFMAVVVVAVLGGAGLYVVNQFRGGERTGEPFTMTIPDGASMAQASDILQEQGVIKNSTVFRYYGRWKGIEQIKAGDYDNLYKNMSLDDTITRLRAGPLPQKSVQISLPEGLTEKEIHAKILNTFPEMTETELGLAEIYFGALDGKYHKAGQPLEGFLFPATYRVEKPELADEAKVVAQQLKQFDKVADDVGLDKATEKLNGAAGPKTPISPYQALIIASIIEREVKVPDERAKVARVIYNRLAKGMKLEIDATVLYCFPERKTELTKADLAVDCPYNTRQKGGLPPTPISSPGKASLEAALNPEPGPWLYYVLSDKEGRHFFTDDSKAFDRQVQESQKAGLI
ncbi:MAG: endolytic transglycosylase MltG [Actinobacteria bacterium]|nr:endolytic transglycosylase MltG [Actinomycetota bacterium]